jgi:hypothetical protein
LKADILQLLMDRRPAIEDGEEALVGEEVSVGGEAGVGVLAGEEVGEEVGAEDLEVVLVGK